MPPRPLCGVRQCKMKGLVRSLMETRIVHISRWFKYCLVFVISGASTVTPLLCQSVEPVAIPVEMGNKEMTYDINTIKQHKERGADEEWSGIEMLPDGIASKNISLLSLVQIAYGITAPGSVSALPKWASSARFDVEFRMAPPVAEAFAQFSEDQQVVQRQYMLQLVLLDRFNLVVHHLLTTSRVYELAVMNESKLEEAKATSTCAKTTKTAIGSADPDILTMGSGQLSGRSVRMSDLAARLGSLADGSVVDNTGLTGTYDIRLQWTPSSQRESTRIDGPLIEALRMQLGLTLRPIEGGVDTIVVDRVQMPAVDWPSTD